MAFCKSCGGQVPDGANNCPHCGAPVASSANMGANNSSYQQAYSGTGEAFLGKDHTAEYSMGDIQANKVACGFAYIPILFWIPLVAAQNSSYGRFHANQGLVLLIFSIALNVAARIIGALWAIPAIGPLFSVLGGIVSWIGGLCELALVIYGMVNTFGGKAVELPLIGRISLIK